MTHEYYKAADEALKKGMEAHLLDIINVFNDNADSADDPLKLRAMYKQILDDPRLIKTITDRFTEILFDDDYVKETETKAAAAAIDEVMKAYDPEDKLSPYVITRDGKEITLTDNEVERILRDRDDRKNRAVLDDLLENIESAAEYEEDSEVRRKYLMVLAALSSDEYKDGFLASLPASVRDMLLEVMTPEMFSESDRLDRDAFMSLFDRVATGSGWKLGGRK